MRLILSELFIAVLSWSHRGAFLVIGDQAMQLESLCILNLLRCGAGVAICVGASVERSVSGAILVCRLGVGPGVDGVDVKKHVDNWKKISGKYDVRVG